MSEACQNIIFSCLDRIALSVSYLEGFYLNDSVWLLWPRLWPNPARNHPHATIHTQPSIPNREATGTVPVKTRPHPKRPESPGIRRVWYVGYAPGRKVLRGLGGWAGKTDEDLRWVEVWIDWLSKYGHTPLIAHLILLC